MSRRTKLLMKENNDLSSQLRAEDNRVLTDMVVYIRGADISEYRQELVRRDITQMLIDGEQRGDTLEEIIGGDYKDFCDSVLNEVPHLTRAEKAVSFLGVVSAALAVLLGIQLLFSLMDLAGENGTWPYVLMTTGNITSLVLILCSALLLYSAITKNSFNTGFLRGKKLLFFLVLVLSACICINVFFNTVVLSLHVFVILVMILVLYMIYKITDAVS